MAEAPHLLALSLKRIVEQRAVLSRKEARSLMDSILELDSSAAESGSGSGAGGDSMASGAGTGGVPAPCVLPTSGAIVLTNNEPGAFYLAADATDLYWTTDSAVRRMPKTGGDPVHRGGRLPQGVDVLAGCRQAVQAVQVQGDGGALAGHGDELLLRQRAVSGEFDVHKPSSHRVATVLSHLRTSLRVCI